MTYRFFLVFSLFVSPCLAVIDSIKLETNPPGLKLTGSSLSVTYTVFQSKNPQTFDLSFFLSCETGVTKTQQLINVNPFPDGKTKGSFILSLCQGDRIKNSIYVIGRETNSSILVPSSTISTRSDTVAPDPPNIDDDGIGFPRVVYTPTFQIRGNVDNQNPMGNSTDKPETSGTVEIFYLSEQGKRVILGGGIIQPNSNYIATVDMTLLKPGQTVSLIIIARDGLGNETFRSSLSELSRPCPMRPERSKRIHKFNELYKEQ